MLPGLAVIAVALGYIGLLFVIASYGDRIRQFDLKSRSRLLIYPLSLAIYCTSWTFFGSVGLASRSGYDFLTIYIGPMVMIGLCTPLIMRIVRLAKAQNITSIADFIAARYGKDQRWSRPSPSSGPSPTSHCSSRRYRHRCAPSCRIPASNRRG